jgi:hypothetical protein
LAQELVHIGARLAPTSPALARRERVRIRTERVDARLTEARQINVRMEEIVGLLRQREDAMNEQPRER